MDMKKMNHEKLTGGRVTQNIIKIGNTVRRPLSQNANFVHALLQHLEKVGFNGAPRFLGIDELNREILTFIEGDVPPDLDEWEDSQLVAAAKLIREYHDATHSCNLIGNFDIICHNDLSPCNAVWIEGKPTAFIDFDAAAPGTRAADLAYAVWMWCCLGEEEIDPKEQSRRMKLMLDAYGFDQRQDFIEKIIEIQRKQIEMYKLRVEEGLHHHNWINAINWTNKCIEWIKIHQEELENGIYL